jgi:phosphatidylserine/phosphatidylglycerophosphate/cardiolipin synthase-like enzyme
VIVTLRRVCIAARSAQFLIRGFSVPRPVLLAVVVALSCITLTSCAKNDSSNDEAVTPSLEAVFSPNCATRILELIQGADRSIYISYHRSSQRSEFRLIAEALKAAMKRGVSVTVILDKYKYGATQKRHGKQAIQLYDELLDSGARLHMYKPKGIDGFSYLHSKIIMVDDFVMVGTMDIKDKDSELENFLIVQDPQVHAAYLSAMQLYLQDSWPRTNPPYIQQGTPAQPFFGPNEDFAQPLIAVVRAAKKSIDIAVVDLSFAPFVSALEAAAQRGVTVQIVVTAVFRKNLAAKHAEILTALLRLKRAGAVVKWHRSAGVHFKSMVIDGAVVATGSPGYDHKPMSQVVETYLVVSSEAIATEFLREIRQVFENPGAKPITQADLDHVLALKQERDK